MYTRVREVQEYTCAFAELVLPHPLSLSARQREVALPALLLLSELLQVSHDFT